MELENEMISSSSNSSAGSREYKVVMLGAGGVGKSGKFQRQHICLERVNWECKVERRMINEGFHSSSSSFFFSHCLDKRIYNWWLGQ